MADESKPDPQFAEFLKQLFTAPSAASGDESEKPPNLLQTFASLGSELKRQAQGAGDEFCQHMAEVRRTAPPMRIHAKPASDVAWTHDPEAVRRIQALERAGYVQEGVFEFDPLPHYATISFRHPGRDTAAFISKTSKGISFEMESRYADGRIFELCDATPPAGLQSPPWMTRRFHPERTPDELIAAQDSERPAGALVALEPGQAIHWVEEGFARIQAWRADRAGWTREEICRQRGWTETALTPEQAEALEGARHENIERWLFNWLRIQPGIPGNVDAWVDSLVIVSEDMTPDMAMAAWAGGTGDPDIGRGRLESADPRAEFAALNAERGSPLKLLWQKATPPKADFYQPQEQPRRIHHRSALGDALNEGLVRGDLRRSLMAVAGEEVSTREDAEAIVETLEQLQSGPVRDLPRQVQAVARLFSAARDRDSAAYPVLRDRGIPHLVRLYDTLRSTAPDEAGDILLALLKVLVVFEADAGMERVLDAVRRPLNPEGMAWSAVLRAFFPAHPHRDRFLAAVSTPLPCDGIAQALLNVVTGARESGDAFTHPFDSTEGLHRLEEWLAEPNPEHFGRAQSAVVALRYLPNSESLSQQALTHPETDIRFTAARIRAEAGHSDALDFLVGACRHWSTAAQAKEILTELGRENQIPDAAKEPAFSALAEMAAWLAHPNELARVPDELEIVDHRVLRWPPSGEEKPFWLIRYRARATDDDETDDVGWGLVGSITFALFGYDLHLGSAEDAYAVHCYWELYQSDHIEEEDLEEDSPEHALLLEQWTGAPLESAKVVQLARLSADLDPGEPVIALARATRDGEEGWVILDGPRTHWIAGSHEDDRGHLALKRHVGRRVLAGSV